MGPAFLRLSPGEQRARFLDISRSCEQHLEEGMTVPGLRWASSAALLPVNRSRNRYSNVFPWDRTRVALRTAKDPASNYINALWVELDGRRYIAAQGPLALTVHHFWAMCWGQAEAQQATSVFIAMLTPLEELGREKCAAYWPLRGEKWDLSQAMERDGLEPADLSVRWVSEATGPGLITTTLALASHGVERIVHHCFYPGWQDTRTPDAVEPLVALSGEISLARAADPAVLPVVHCSAGVGRTGTFIAVDHFLNSDIFATDGDPVYATVQRLREHRMMMVQTVHQYHFLYTVARQLYRELLG